MREESAPRAWMVKVRCGSDTYVKEDGSVGTAGKGPLISEEVAFTLATTQDQTLFQDAECLTPWDVQSRRVFPEDGAWPALYAGDGGGHGYVMKETDMDDYIVRRLMPVECERLQGFPDGHTDLTGCDAGAVAEALLEALCPEGEKERKALERKVAKWSGECPDGPRYKACGNSMAVPCIRWLGDRIEMVDELVADLMLEGEL